MAAAQASQPPSAPPRPHRARRLHRAPRPLRGLDRRVEVEAPPRSGCEQRARRLSRGRQLAAGAGAREPWAAVAPPAQLADAAAAGAWVDASRPSVQPTVGAAPGEAARTLGDAPAAAAAPTGGVAERTSGAWPGAPATSPGRGTLRRPFVGERAGSAASSASSVCLRRTCSYLLHPITRGAAAAGPPHQSSRGSAAARPSETSRQHREWRQCPPVTSRSRRPTPD